MDGSDFLEVLAKYDPREPNDIASLLIESNKRLVIRKVENYLDRYRLLTIIHQEVSEYVKLIKFSTQEKDVDTSFQYIGDYIKVLLQKLLRNEEEILDIINTPAYQDPLSKLEMLQKTEVGNLTKFPVLELILPAELSTGLKLYFDALAVPSKQVYLQLIFDCINEALNHIRPFGIKGLPDPWSLVCPTLYGEGQLKTVFMKVTKIVQKWEAMKIGTCSDNSCKNDEEMLKRQREEALGKLVSLEVVKDDKNWMEYQDEETQIVIDAADLVFDFVVDEVLFVVSGLSPVLKVL